MIVVTAVGGFDASDFGHPTARNASGQVVTAGFDPVKFGVPRTANLDSSAYVPADFTPAPVTAGLPPNFYFGSSQLVPITALSGGSFSAFGYPVVSNSAKACTAIGADHSVIGTPNISFKEVNGGALYLNLTEPQYLKEFDQVRFFWGGRTFFPTGAEFAGFGVPFLECGPAATAIGWDSAVFGRFPSVGRSYTNGNSVYLNFTGSYSPSANTNIYFGTGVGFAGVGLGDVSSTGRPSVANVALGSEFQGADSAKFGNPFVYRSGVAAKLDFYFRSGNYEIPPATNVPFYFWGGRNLYPAGFNALEFGDWTIEVESQDLNFTSQWALKAPTGEALSELKQTQRWALKVPESITTSQKWQVDTVIGSASRPQDQSWALQSATGTSQLQLGQGWSLQAPVTGERQASFSWELKAPTASDRQASFSWELKAPSAAVTIQASDQWSLAGSGESLLTLSVQWALNASLGAAELSDEQRWALYAPEAVDSPFSQLWEQKAGAIDSVEFSGRWAQPATQIGSRPFSDEWASDVVGTENVRSFALNQKWALEETATEANSQLASGMWSLFTTFKEIVLPPGDPEGINTLRLDVLYKRIPPPPPAPPPTPGGGGGGSGGGGGGGGGGGYPPYPPWEPPVLEGVNLLRLDVLRARPGVSGINCVRVDVLHSKVARRRRPTVYLNM